MFIKIKLLKYYISLPNLVLGFSPKSQSTDQIFYDVCQIHTFFKTLTM